MISVALNPKFIAVDVDGVPLAGAKLYTYESLTATPKVTYTDYTMGTPNTNPVVLDAGGQADVWIDGIYRFKLVTAEGVTVWTKDGVGPTVSDMLSSFMGLSITANKLPYGSGVNEFSLTDLTAFARALLADTSAAEVRADLNVFDKLFSIHSGTTGATVDTYTTTFSPTLSGYTTGDYYFIGFNAANTATAPTLNIDGLGAKTIKNVGGYALFPGEILAGHRAILRYNGTDLILLNSAARLVGTVAESVAAGNDTRLTSRCQLFTASGTWTRPAGVTRIKATLQAPGGGGGGAAGVFASGGGGGRGGEGVVIADVDGDIVITIQDPGTGGAPGNGSTNGTAGTTGGTVYLGALASCSGGVGGGGAQYATPTPGTGGAAGELSVGAGAVMVSKSRHSGWAGNTGDPSYPGSGGGYYPTIGLDFGTMGRGGYGGASGTTYWDGGQNGGAGCILIEW